MARTSSNESSFATAVLAALNAPVTASNLQFMESWIAREGGGGANNPLNTTQVMGASNVLAGNTAGVQNYSDLQTGVNATIKTLQNGYYPNILAALHAGNASEADAQGHLSKDLSTWSGGGYTTVTGTSANPTNSIGLGGGTSTGSGRGAQTSPKLDEQSLASEYGFAAAFFSIDPELQTLINSAVAQQWTPQKFQAEFQATKWYQSHAESVRDFLTLEKTDPASFNAKLSQKVADVKSDAASLGANLDDATLKTLATNALEFGWDDQQLQQALGTHVSVTNPAGSAAANLQTMQGYVASMGINMSDQTLQNYLTQIQSGTSTMDTFEANVRKLAASAFPSYAVQINAGQTVKDIADPYMQDMASILELNPSSITLQDPTIRKALTGTDANGQPAQPGLYQFEQQLRQDPRWQYTKNATDDTYSMIRTIGQQWGFLS